MTALFLFCHTQEFGTAQVLVLVPPTSFVGQLAAGRRLLRQHENRDTIVVSTAAKNNARELKVLLCPRPAESISAFSLIETLPILVR